MKFNNIMEQALNNTTLKRVRFKTDPQDSRNPRNSSPYEGYIIEENEGMLRIMVVGPEHEQDTVDMDPCDVEPASGKTFDQFKKFVMKYITDRKKQNHSEADHYNIIRAGDVQHLEAFMKEHGIEREEFEQISRLFLMS